MTEQDLRRRSFLATAAAATGSALAGCSSIFGDGDDDDDESQPDDAPTTRADNVEKYPRIQVGSVDELSAGDVQTFDYPLDGKSNFLTRIDGQAWGGVGPEDSIVAYSSLCTHMGCGVSGQVKPDQEMAGPCPCHYTTFDLSKGGLVVSGAATTDLPQIRLDIEDGEIYATGVDGLVYGQRHNLQDGELVSTEE
jgi:arsenite oxidase small subunit